MQKILLVDDERNVHYSLQRALGQTCRILSAFTGEEALQRLKLLAPTLPVILLTAYGTTDIAITAMKMGAYDYLLKPVDIPALKGLLNKALQPSSLSHPPGLTTRSQSAAHRRWPSIREKPAAVLKNT